MSANFARTLDKDKEDQRRPRMELALGVWTTATHRCYPMQRIHKRGRASVDQLDGRKVLIYIDPETNTPGAFFIDELSAKIQDNEVHLDNGGAARDRVLLDPRGKRAKAERPQQVFTRWYGLLCFDLPRM